MKKFIPGECDPVTDDEQKKPYRIRINHVLGSHWTLSMMEVFSYHFARWIACKKKFRVIIDFDPEWTMLIHFRLSTKEESAMLNSLNPNKDMEGRCNNEHAQGIQPR